MGVCSTTNFNFLWYPTMHKRFHKMYLKAAYMRMIKKWIRIEHWLGQIHVSMSWRSVMISCCEFCFVLCFHWNITSSYISGILTLLELSANESLGDYESLFHNYLSWCAIDISFSTILGIAQCHDDTDSQNCSHNFPNIHFFLLI